ncbi:hypothetical protein NMG60_11013512 [Bertholletia excelsa]
MMIGEATQALFHGPKVHVPPWSAANDPTVETSFLYIADDFSPFDAGVRRKDAVFDAGEESDYPVHDYSCDNFMMFEFKVRNCTRGRSHDWTECPYAHPGEKARRRDPRRYHYSGTACPEFRKGNCKKGELCEFSHGVFECWLHPARYRTQPCKEGLNCRRRVCFFAHSPEELRILSPRTTGPGETSGLSFGSSPESISPPAESPPMSPMTASTPLSRSVGSSSINEMVASLRRLQLSKVKSMSSSWGAQVGEPGFASPRVVRPRPACFSLPSTPTSVPTRAFDLWGKDGGEEEPVMERVESGRCLRAKMLEKLSRENPLDRVELNPPSPGPDVGWVSELVK